MAKVSLVLSPEQKLVDELKKLSPDDKRRVLISLPPEVGSLFGDIVTGKKQLSPEQMASNAGRMCYESDIPELHKEMIKVKERLYDPGHHTTLEHAPSYFTFEVDDISVSTVELGLHLAHPFYNSDQRSGRFSKMYDNPNLEEAEARINKYFPDESKTAAMDMIGYGINVFQENKENLTDVAADTLKKERPNVTDKYIESNAKKMAQEQLRVFISTVAPTALYHTIDLVTLAALDKVAWTAELRDAVNQMSTLVVERYPSLSYMFGIRDNNRIVFSKSQGIDADDEKGVRTSPSCKIKHINIPDEDYVPEKPDSDFKVDTRMIDPSCMKNGLYTISSAVEMSFMTMGQDQRHRTLRRSMPKFTGDFYLPPLLKIHGLEKTAEYFRGLWVNLLKTKPAMANFVVPYGAMVKYEKTGDLNAILHEQEKRLCWCAQEEIYNLNTQMAMELSRLGYYKLVHDLKPHCGRWGNCIEGPRYCGRDMSVWKNGVAAGFTQRQI